MKHIPVKEIMTSNLVTAQVETPLARAVELLRRNRIHSLPVTDTDNRLLGVITETDLFLKEKGLCFSMEKVPSILGRLVDKEDIDHLEGAGQVPVGDVMTRTVITVDEDTTLEDLAMTMYENHLTCVPVTREEQVVGVVSRIDVLDVIYGIGMN